MQDAGVRGESQMVRQKVVSATDSSFSQSPPEIQADARPPSVGHVISSLRGSQKRTENQFWVCGIGKKAHTQWPGAPQLSLSSHTGLLREIVAVRVYKSSSYRWQNELIVDNRYTSLWITV